MSGCCSKQLLLLIITVISKLCFSILVLSGSVLDHSGSPQDRLKELCGDWMCFHHVKEGLMISGFILLFFSIFTEAFVRIMKLNICVIIIQMLGSLLLIFSSAIDFLSRPSMSRNLVLVYGGGSNFLAGFWVAGGLIIATCQLYITYFNRTEGILYLITMILAFLGWSMFIVYGTLRIESVAIEIIGNRGYYDGSVYFWNMTNSLLISGCVLYIVHAILYAFVMFGKMSGRSISRSDSSTSTLYDNTLNPNAYQMITLPLSTELEGEEVDIAEA